MSCEPVSNVKPHIVYITETKPKHAKFNLTPAELNMEDYKIFYNSLTTGDGTRGCAIYVINSLEVQEVEIISAFADSLWVEIKLVGGDKLLVGCVYRSPNSSDASNAALRELLVQVTNKNYSHLLISGDFNFPKIDWRNWNTTTNNDEDQESMFIEAVRDGYLHQHIHQHTRIRGDDDPSLIDLLFTNEEGMIDEVEIQSPLGKSDHAMIQFKFNCYNVLSQNSPAKFMFNRGNYDNLKTELSRVNWDDLIRPGDSVNNQWLLFASTVMDAMNTHIPKFTPKQGTKRKYLTPLDKNAISKIKKKA